MSCKSRRLYDDIKKLNGVFSWVEAATAKWWNVVLVLFWRVVESQQANSHGFGVGRGARNKTSNY